ncbi:MAG: hypothetical protein D6765_04135, partial [Bacteroidetes bacterium]
KQLPYSAPPPAEPKKPTPPAEKKAPETPPVANGSAPLSLEAFQAEVETEHAEEAAAPLPEIDEKQLRAALEKYLPKARPAVRGILQNADIALEDERVLFKVASTVSANTLLQELDIMEFLRAELKHPKLIMRAEVDPEKAKANLAPKRAKPLTESEIYWRMKEQNPLIDELRKRFDLHFDQE